MKDFEDFRNNWLTQEKLNEIRNRSEQQTEEIKNKNIQSCMATFSATYSLLLLAEFHEWMESQEAQS